MSKHDYQKLIDLVDAQRLRAHQDWERAQAANKRKDAYYAIGERDGYVQTIRMLQHQQEHA